MCGIIGFYTKNNVTEKHRDILYKLIYQSKIRGLHSFGISYLENGIIKTEKTFDIPEISFLDGFYKSQSNILIAHTRYSTSGDYKIMENNQPIQISENISVALNGVLTMKPREEYEVEFDVQCITENDTEILARKIEKGMNISEFSRYITGSLAAVYIYNKNLYAIRNNKRPMHVFTYEGGVFVVSTVDIVDRALDKHVKIKPVTPFRLVKFLNFS